MSDVWLFLKEFARNPGQLGAVTPSSRKLAASVVEAAGLSDDQIIVELGAGTGPFTRAVREAVPSATFVALEPSEPLAVRLREQMPDLDVDGRYASELRAILDDRELPHCHRVISGLPWAVFPDEAQRQTLRAVCDCLTADGRFVTFQYVHSQVLPAARKFRELLDEHFESVQKSKITWRNVPPAFLFVCERAKG